VFLTAQDSGEIGLKVGLESKDFKKPLSESEGDIVEETPKQAQHELVSYLMRKVRAVSHHSMTK
jgi:hypothetical protein